MRLPVFGALCALVLAVPVHALDVTVCGTVVPPHEDAFLRNDLACPANGPQYAVYLGAGATLVMNGHRILGEDFEDAIGCDASCTIVGPGEIGGFEYGISTNGGTVTVSDLEIHDCEIGVIGTTIRATNVVAHHHEEWAFGVVKNMKARGVVATDNGRYGFFGPQLAVKDGTFSRNGDHGVNAFEAFRGTGVVAADNAGAGILGGKINVKNLTATGNAGGGVAGHPTVALRDATVQDNTIADVQSERAPKLKDVTCGTSMQSLSPEQSWGVCSAD
jgi:hypothetical protein